MNKSNKSKVAEHQNKAVLAQMRDRTIHEVSQPKPNCLRIDFCDETYIIFKAKNIKDKNTITLGEYDFFDHQGSSTEEEIVHLRVNADVGTGNFNLDAEMTVSELKAWREHESTKNFEDSCDELADHVTTIWIHDVFSWLDVWYTDPETGKEVHLSNDIF